jgi:hypothetical protein
MAYTNIDDPSAHFQTALYTGNATDRSITNTGNSDLQPDFVWIKPRNATFDHLLQDSSRGVTKYLRSNSTQAEATATSIIQAFETNGFSLSAGGSWNQSGQTDVAWQWKANGGTTSSNTDGTITTTVQANTTAGFSIATWTGNGTNGATIGHGNGGIPNGYIVKRLDATSDWAVGGGYTGNVWVGGTSAVMHLNNTDAVSEAYNNYWGSSFPNSQILPLSQNAEINASGGSYVGYFFRSIQGYSKLGRYTGNGANNGSFIYTGFAPAFVMIKNTSTATNWEMFDVKRNPSNVRNLKLGANLSVAENGSDLGTTTQNNIDILSNGFKCRTGNTDTNVNGHTFIYMAFAENPFVTSTGIMGTAR